MSLCCSPPSSDFRTEAFWILISLVFTVLMLSSFPIFPSPTFTMTSNSSPRPPFFLFHNSGKRKRPNIYKISTEKGFLGLFSVLGTEVAQSIQITSDTVKQDTPLLFSRIENENIVLGLHFVYHQKAGYKII